MSILDRIDTLPAWPALLALGLALAAPVLAILAMPVN